MGPSISGLFRRGAGRSEVCASTLALAAVDHRHLDLVRQHFEVTGQPIEHRALGLVGRKVADSGTLRGVPSQLFDLWADCARSQSSRLACSAQNPSGSLIERAYISSYCALVVSVRDLAASLGSNTRLSLIGSSRNSCKAF